MRTTSQRYYSRVDSQTFEVNIPQIFVKPPKTQNYDNQIASFPQNSEVKFSPQQIFVVSHPKP